MAYLLKLSTVTKQLVDIIETNLRFQPDVQQNKYNKNAELPKPINFYKVDSDGIHIPYLFAAGLLKICPNLDISYPNVTINFTGNLRDYQVSAEQESWVQLERIGTSTLGLYPGFGKTILGAKLSSRAKLLTVILVHREILTTQWRKTYQDFTDARVWIVGEKDPPPICDVIICMDTRWAQIPKQMRDMVGFLIIDEAHAFCTPMHVDCLLAFHPKYILLESATLERDDRMEHMMYAIAGEHGVVRETNKPFVVMKINTNTKPPRKLNYRKGVNWTALVKDTLFDVRRNQIITSLVTNNPNNTILILTSLVEHAMLLYETLSKMGISCDYMCGNRKSYNDCRVLIGTMSKIGTGFDQSTACPNYSGRRFDLLILCASIKKEAALVQNIGRVFRADYPIVMHLVDNDDIYKSHWNKAKRWFLRHGGVITEHDIPNNEVPPANNVSSVQQQWIQSKQNKQLTLKLQK